MKANFALSLSHDGIILLHRSAAGWYPVGEADPASDTLEDDLASLRRAALALAPGGLRCKIIIPHDQIRYLSVETPGLGCDARQAAAIAALEGATPYAVSELVLDTFADGDTTHVAAVARETLQEAEAFAQDHEFAPINFAALPQQNGFATEAFFGETRSAVELLGPDETVDRETVPFILAEEESEPLAVVSKAPGVEEDAATDLAVISEQDEEEDFEPGFVSRRRVPTFRTAPPDDAFKGATDASIPGFGEPPPTFEQTSRTESTQAMAQSVVPAPAPVVRRLENEAERFTIYGAEKTRGASSRSGYSGVALLTGVVLLAGIGAFASVTVNGGLSSLLQSVRPAEPRAQFTAPVQPAAPLTVAETPEATTDAEPGLKLASLAPELTDEDTAVLDALAEPDPVLEAPPQDPTLDDLRAAYAVSGVWPVAPDVPSPPPLVDLDDLYVTGIDPVNPNFDAVALPSVPDAPHERAYLAPASPAPAGTQFVLDERNMVVATPEGAMNPDGILVFTGPPALRPPINMVKAEDPGVDLSERLRLAAFRPQSRPDDLIENTERAAFSGLTRSELGQVRPRLRPESAQETALASAGSLVQLDGSNSRSLLEQPEGTSFDSATARAIVASLRPGARPKDFDKTVSAAQRVQPAPSPVTTSSATIAPRAVAPKIPSSASVSREATVKNAINLRQVNLIGVYGKPSQRRALIRLGNGRYQKVKVGDRIDGGRVSAIGDAELRYQKSGRAVILKMPRS